MIHPVFICSLRISCVVQWPLLGTYLISGTCLIVVMPWRFTWAQITDSVLYNHLSQMAKCAFSSSDIGCEWAKPFFISLMTAQSLFWHWPQVSKACISLIISQSLLKPLISVNGESLVDKIAQNAFRELLFHMGSVPQMCWFSCINKRYTRTASACQELWPLESISLLLKGHA